jgi:hypothetical protein
MESDSSTSDQDTNETDNMDGSMPLKRPSADLSELISKQPRHDSPTKLQGWEHQVISMNFCLPNTLILNFHSEISYPSEPSTEENSKSDV